MSKEEIYDSQVSPLMARIIDICKEHKIAMLASFCLDVEGDGLMCTSALLEDEYEPSKSQLRALEIIKPKPAFVAALTITTRPT